MYEECMARNNQVCHCGIRGAMPSEIFQISLERIKQQLYRQSKEHKIRLGAFSDDRIHDWIQTLDEASWFLEEELQRRIRNKVSHFPNG